MGFIPVLMGIIAASLFYRTDASGLMWVSAGLTVLNLWSYGVMHNFAVEAAKARSGYHGEFSDFTRSEVQAVPNWITNINLASAMMTLVATIVAIYKTFA